MIEGKPQTRQELDSLISVLDFRIEALHKEYLGTAVPLVALLGALCWRLFEAVPTVKCWADVAGTTVVVATVLVGFLVFLTLLMSEPGKVYQGRPHPVTMRVCGGIFFPVASVVSYLGFRFGLPACGGLWAATATAFLYSVVRGLVDAPSEHSTSGRTYMREVQAVASLVATPIIVAGTILKDSPALGSHVALDNIVGGGCAVGVFLLFVLATSVAYWFGRAQLVELRLDVAMSSDVADARRKMDATVLMFPIHRSKEQS